MNLVEYSTLNYYHTPVSEECLCLGVLAHNITTGQCDFRSISNFKRFQSFDDEADINFVKAYLSGIKEEVETNILNYKYMDSFNLETYIKPFANEFKFSPIKELNVDENENYMEELVKVFLKYDMEKSQRLSSKDERSVIKRIFESCGIKYTKGKTQGEFQDEISFDYQFNNDIFVKYFSFKGTNLKRNINNARLWSFAASELTGTKKALFIYDSDNLDEVNLNIIVNILSKYAKVIHTDEALDNILKEAIG